MTHYDVWLLFFQFPWPKYGLYPLGIASLSAYLKARQLKVKSYSITLPVTKNCMKNISEGPYKYPPLFRDMLCDPEKLKKDKNLYHDFITITKLIGAWITAIKKNGPKAIGISLNIRNLTFSLLLAREIKREIPDILVILGGTECNPLNRELFIREGFADVVIIGEGEESLYQVLVGMKRKDFPSMCPGAMLKKGDSIVDGGPAPAIDLNRLPVPDFEDFIHGPISSRQALSVAFNRGCLFKCKFCNEILLWKNFREMDVEHSIKTIKSLKKSHGVQRFFLSQSLINGNLSWLEEFADALIRSNLDICWGGNARIHPGMNEKYLRKLYKGGCRFLDFGIESGSQKILNNMKKGINIHTAEKVIRATSEAGIWVHSYWIFGFPGEGEKEFIETLGFIMRNSRYIDSYRVYRYRRGGAQRKIIDERMFVKSIIDYLKINSRYHDSMGSCLKKYDILFKKFIPILNFKGVEDIQFFISHNATKDYDKYKGSAGNGWKREVETWVLLALYLLKFCLEHKDLSDNIVSKISLPRFTRVWEEYTREYLTLKGNISPDHNDMGRYAYNLLVQDIKKS